MPRKLSTMLSTLLHWTHWKNKHVAVCVSKNKHVHRHVVHVDVSFHVHPYTVPRPHDPFNKLHICILGRVPIKTKLHTIHGDIVYSLSDLHSTTWQLHASRKLRSRHVSHTPEVCTHPRGSPYSVRSNFRVQVRKNDFLYIWNQLNKWIIAAMDYLPCGIQY